MAETGASDSSSPETDRDFDPSADMLVHDYDDEHTLEEEEAMSGDSCSNELDDLEREGDMPLEQLLAMYKYADEPQDTRSSSEEEILSNQDLTLDKEEIARDLLKTSDDDDDKETTVNDLLNSVHVSSAQSQTNRLLRSNSQDGSENEEDEDSEEDSDYHQPIEIVDDWKKTIQVGSDYQASVPEGLCKYGDAPAYENEDRLLWDPNKLTDSVVEKYLDEIHTQSLINAAGVEAVGTGIHIRDDEQALYLLLQCGHNVEEALRRRKMQAVPPTDPMSLWSEEECRNFENGLRTYGKDFYLIQQNKVKTRSVGELVQFYYLWKKTERHDMFANKNRLEKRKYSLHPGVTDYMDRFLDDQESPAAAHVRERSASPVNSLIYGDPKRNQLKPPSSDTDTSSNYHIGEPKDFDLSAASPTVVRPEIKRHSPSSPRGTNNVLRVSPGFNGSFDEVIEPLNKKIKTDSEHSHYELQESYSDNNHIDSMSLVSVASGLTQSEHTLTSVGALNAELHPVKHASAESVVL
ncbi:mesoderm induction early response protein 1-like isoform X2 [Mizuhopecten yessoensis]|uniref:mesoderm induction early response protein 1-like isoform X2 n=1 Tax=Mizuhopecten yessoensis TaxID=6573 RepID=UPI000B45B4B2|nr:mesoderm induction early response protein 1-like isoform X2 [Mizuhopecten yessoensis]